LRSMARSPGRPRMLSEFLLRPVPAQITGNRPRHWQFYQLRPPVSRDNAVRKSWCGSENRSLQNRFLPLTSPFASDTKV
jgi:hypothetical protein